MNTWREADAAAREFLPQMDQLRWNEDHMIFAGIVTAAAACWRFECGIAKEHEENQLRLGSRLRSYIRRYGCISGSHSAFVT
jgi:hypothetical protein